MNFLMPYFNKDSFIFCISGYFENFLSIKSIGIGEYIGIEIDSNQRFVLNDFTRSGLAPRSSISKSAAAFR